MNEEKVVWEAYEFRYKEKTADWFWAVVIIVVSISAIAALFANFLFALFILLAGAVLLRQSKQRPRVLRFELNAKGVRISNETITYSNIRAFWVESNKFSQPKLILSIERFINPIVVIPIETDLIDPEEVRDHLYQYVPEERIIEPLSQRIMEYLGF